MIDIKNWLQQALAFHQAGKLDAAKLLYSKILEKDPDNVESLFLLGTLSSDVGDLDKAETLLKKAITALPDYAESHNNLAIVYLAQANYEAAVLSFRQAVVLKPEYYDAHFNLGVAYHQLSRFEEALESYQTTVEHKPDHDKAYYNMGVIFHDNGRLNEASKCYSNAVAINPEYVMAYNNLGDVYQKLEQYSEAIGSYSRAISLKPDYAEAHYNLAILYQTMGNYDISIESYKKAISFKPDYAEAHYNLGNLYNEQWMPGEAVESFKSALVLKPDYAEAYNNLGEALQRQGKLVEAAANYTLAFKYKPDYLMARFNLSIALLLMGDYLNGWREYEQRLLIPKYNKREFKQPKWDGIPLAGKKILVHAEQGFGDTFQFLRYLPMVQSLGGHVVFECQSGLSSLLNRCDGFDEIIEKAPEGSDEPTSDLFVPLMSLPTLFKTKVSSIPANVPYIFPDPELVERWKQRLDELCSTPEKGRPASFKIGLVWAGKPDRKYDKVRSCKLAQFAPLGLVPDSVIFSLQKGEAVKQIGESGDGFNIINLEKELDVTTKFVDTAAVISNLDLVISIDSAVAHLAGALGKNVWTILPFAHDWRWLEKREDTPWYPDMRLFRQKKIGDWEEVVNRIVQELRIICQIKY